MATEDAVVSAVAVGGEADTILTIELAALGRGGCVYPTPYFVD